RRRQRESREGSVDGNRRFPEEESWKLTHLSSRGTPRDLGRQKTPRSLGVPRNDTREERRHMSDLVEAKFSVNGKPVALSADPNRSVLEILREELQLTGTKYGCGEGACGACTILVDGNPKFSCSILLEEIV